MTALRRGVLYFASLDKRRPSLVISHDIRNTHASTVLVIPCTTTLRALSTHVRLRRGEGGVRETSVLQCELITTLPKHAVDPEPIGLPLAASRIHDVEAAVMRAIGIAVPF